MLRVGISNWCGIVLIICAGLITFVWSRVGWTNESSVITVHVTSQPSHFVGEVVPKAQAINGKMMATISKGETGQIVAVAPDTYILIRSDAKGFSVSSTGILEVPPGRYHLPNGII